MATALGRETKTEERGKLSSPVFGVTRKSGSQQSCKIKMEGRKDKVGRRRQGKARGLRPGWFSRDVDTFFSFNAFAKRNRFHMCKSKGSLVRSQLVVQPSFQHLPRGKGFFSCRSFFQGRECREDP